MRTTLTLEDDVAAQLERLRRQRHLSLKQVVNLALREGLATLKKPPSRKQQFQTRPLNLGRCYLPALDNVAEALVFAEGEDFH